MTLSVLSSDDRGTAFTGPPPRRVVSLVPSLTEAIAATDLGLLAGATDWCTHRPTSTSPASAAPSGPTWTACWATAPDLVVANAEENRDEDVAALRAAGSPCG